MISCIKCKISHWKIYLFYRISKALLSLFILPLLPFTRFSSFLFLCCIFVLNITAVPFADVFFFFLSFSLHYTMCLHSCLLAGASETERRLHQKLFENYNMKVRPARYWEDKVTVRVGMTLSQLVSLVNEQHKHKYSLRHANKIFYILPVKDSG